MIITKDLIGLIAFYLVDRDFKSWRATCKTTHATLAAETIIRSGRNITGYGYIPFLRLRDDRNLIHGSTVYINQGFYPHVVYPHPNFNTTVLSRVANIPKARYTRKRKVKADFLLLADISMNLSCLCFL